MIEVISYSRIQVFEIKENTDTIIKVEIKITLTNVKNRFPGGKNCLLMEKIISVNMFEHHWMTSWYSKHCSLYEVKK